MSESSGRLVGRRWVIRQAGRGVVGFAVLGLVGCGDDEPAASDDTSPSPTPTEESPSPAAADLTWSRVDLGFVSAYVLVRGAEAAVVDTGVGGSARAIETALREEGADWDAVRHVVLTHKHPDHVGSLGEVLDRAANATGYAGEADLGEIQSPQPLRAVGDADEVMGLRIVATPGHTAGHVASFDEGTGVLLAGDALTNDGRLAGSNPQFTEDTAAAEASVRTLADLEPTTILVGHGAPVTEGAAAALRRLADSL